MLLTRYERDQHRYGYTADPAQRAAIEQLQGVYNRLIASRQEQLRRRVSLWGLFKSPKSQPVTGLYLWGGVGRGKTYVMDLFFEALPPEKKLRTHFHRFMRRVHRELDLLKGQKNPLDAVADIFAQQADIICFDEFFISEITDAMILANLLEGLFQRGVTLIATSNIEPKGLYENGLQRESFLPAIKLLEKHTFVYHMDGSEDHRLRALQQAELYYFPLNELAKRAMSECFDRLAGKVESARKGGAVSIEGRDIPMLWELDDLIWFDFLALCDGPRSQADYIVIAKEYHTVFVSDIPQLTTDNDDQARRFIYMVDEFYDRGVKLVLSAGSAITDLYQGIKLKFEIQRTYSRLLEMQSQEYLSRPHKS